MRINLIVIGKIKEKYFADACSEYLKRLTRFAKVNVIEIAETALRDGGKNDILRVIESECKSITDKANGYRIALDLEGDMVSSQDFADILHTNAVAGIGEITFIIGGSNGLTRQLVQGCDKQFCLGRITYPHQLIRVVLLEQIYRGFMINAGAEYHK